LQQLLYGCSGTHSGRNGQQNENNDDDDSDGDDDDGSKDEVENTDREEGKAIIVNGSVNVGQ
jgi:hypothetical protein